MGLGFLRQECPSFLPRLGKLRFGNMERKLEDDRAEMSRVVCYPGNDDKGRCRKTWLECVKGDTRNVGYVRLMPKIVRCRRLSYLTKRLSRSDVESRRKTMMRIIIIILIVFIVCFFMLSTVQMSHQNVVSFTRLWIWLSIPNVGKQQVYLLLRFGLKLNLYRQMNFLSATTSLLVSSNTWNLEKHSVYCGAGHHWHHSLISRKILTATPPNIAFNSNSKPPTPQSWSLQQPFDKWT